MYNELKNDKKLNIDKLCNFALKYCHYNILHNCLPIDIIFLSNKWENNKFKCNSENNNIFPFDNKYGIMNNINRYPIDWKEIFKRYENKNFDIVLNNEYELLDFLNNKD